MGGQAISDCTSPNLRNMEVKSLCIDLMPAKEIHGQRDTHTDRQTHTRTKTQTHTYGQTDTRTHRQNDNKVRNKEENRTHQTSITRKEFTRKELIKKSQEDEVAE